MRKKECTKRYVKWFPIIVNVCLIMCGCAKKDYEVVHSEMECVSSMRFESDNYSSENIRIVLNKEAVTDPEKTAKEIVDKYIQNGFKTMKFCSQPEELKVTAFLNQGDNVPVLQFSFDFDTLQYEME